jgi:hypothetical protein
VHGDLTPVGNNSDELFCELIPYPLRNSQANILVEKIEDRFSPLITDFGKSRVLREDGYTTTIGNSPMLSVNSLYGDIRTHPQKWLTFVDRPC